MAKSDIGTITIHLKAVASQFTKGIKEASTSIGKFSGTLKHTGVAFTEFQSKLGVSMGALESATKAITASLHAAGGNAEDFLATLKSLPMGMGPVASAFDDLIVVMTGVAEAEERLILAGQQQEAISKRHAIGLKEMHALKKGTLKLEEELAAKTNKATPETRGNKALEDARKQAESLRRISQGELVLSKEKFGSTAMQDILSQSGTIDWENPIEAAHKQRLADIDEELAKREQVIRKTYAVEMAAIKKASDLKTKSTKASLDRRLMSEHAEDLQRDAEMQARLMEAAGKDAQAVAAAKASAESKVLTVMREELKIVRDMEKMGAASRGDVLTMVRDIEKKKQEMDFTSRMGLTKGIASAQTELGKMRSAPPTVRSNTFNTAVGQFTMPDQRANEQNSQAQLAAQQLLVSELEGLRRELKNAGNIHP
tara:strand:- start:300 stop:1580 length:1281 start_codon:yes stop_codon:yes gene_type:complete